MTDQRKIVPEAGVCGGCGKPLPPNAPDHLCPGCLLREGVHLVAASQVKPGAFALPETEDLALLFPEFEIGECLGHGGMGAVYRAVQKEIDRTVAIKLLPPETATDPEFFERFRREAATLGRLDHPNIVKLFDFGQREDFTYFVMEFVDGIDLAQRISQGRCSAEEAFEIIRQACDALRHSHEQGFVHRDVKPANILIAGDGRVKVADFGLARLAHGAEVEMALTRTHATLGTPRYMAPEQLAGATAVDHRADIYAVGVVLYELLTGAAPVGHFDPPSVKVPSLTPRLDGVVLRALAADPERRYSSAEEFKSDLRAAVERPGLTQPQRARRLAWSIVGISVLGSLLGAGVVFFALDRSKDVSTAPASVGQSVVLARSAMVTAFAEPGSPLSGASGERVSDFALAAAYPEFAIALLEDGTLRGWGGNRFGQLDFPADLRDVVSVVAGQGERAGHALALRADGTVAGWGDNTFHQAVPPADLGSVRAIVAGQFHSLALTADGRVVAWGKPGPATDIPVGLRGVQSIAGGADFVVALLEDGTLAAWGDNSEGQCELPMVRDGVEVAAGWRHALVRLRDGRVLAWGDHRQGQCALPSSLPFVAHIFAGGNGSAILDEEGHLYAWGERPGALEDFEGAATRVLPGLESWILLADLEREPPPGP